MVKAKQKLCKGKNKAKDFEGCGQMAYIFSNGLCRNCWGKWKKPHVRPISDKRQKDNKAYSLLREHFLKQPENKICPITGKRAIEIHHTYSGKDRDKYYLITSTWLAVSREGHNWIHENPKEARQKEFLK